MTPEQNDPRLDAALREIREEPIEEAAVQAAADRVWARLPEAGLIEGCEGFRARLADYRAGRLSPGHALLVKDHLHECVACRKEYEGGRKLVAMPKPAAAPVWRWSAAAAVLVAAGLSAWGVTRWLNSRPYSSPLVAQEVHGAVYAVTASTVTPVAQDQTLPDGAEVRTARGAAATLRLRDGSVVEMPERSSFRVTESRRDLTIHLAGGRVLVEAAKNRSRHLYVETRDCRVAVTGTVFSVNSGVKGSRVAVIEGQVLVAQARAEHVLRPGDQYVTSPAMAQVPVEDEIAWSRKVDQHIALLRELTGLRQDLAAVRLPAPRYSSRLLPLVPADTMVYLSLPNLGEALAEAGRLLEQRAKASPAMSAWWQSHGKQITGTIAWVQRAGSRLGDEIVIAIRKSADRPEVLVLSETRGGVREVFESQIQAEGPPIRFAADVAEARRMSKTGLIGIESGNLLAMSTSADALETVLAARAAGTAAAAAPLAAELSRVYRDGAGLLMAVDWQRMLPDKAPANGPLRQVNAVVVGESSQAGAPQTRVEITFDPAKPGPASWLAKPGPIPALDYVTADAEFASAASVKAPSTIVDELFELQRAANPQFAEHLSRAEQELGIKFRDDLAEPLGTQFVVAMDGPLLPTPSWKVVAEVYNSARLQWAIERLVDAARQLAAKEGKPGPSVSQETTGGRVYYRLTLGGRQPLEVHYLYDEGFLVAAPSRAMLERALQTRAAGGGLTRAEKFRALLPRDGYANFSAMLYSHLGTALSPLLGAFTPGDALTPEQRQALEQLAAESKPILVVAYAEAGRVILATAESLTQLSLSHMLGVQSLLGRPLPQKPGTSRAPRAYR